MIGKVSMRIILPLILFYILIAPGNFDPAVAGDEKPQEKIRIALMELKTDDLHPRISSIISNMFRADILNSAKFDIMDRGQMDAILSQQGPELTDCSTRACAVQIGKLLGVKKILTGKVTVEEGSFYITVRLDDIGKNETDYSQRHKILLDKSLDEYVQEISDTMIQRMTAGLEEKKPVAKEEPPVKAAKGGNPCGIMLSYANFTAVSSSVNHYYNAMQGGMIGYAMPIGNYLSILFNTQYVMANNSSLNTSIAFNSYSAGARIGYPLFSVIYPYMSITAKGIWLREKSDVKTSDFFGYGGTASGGIALMFFNSVVLYGEYSYSPARVKDRSGTDISGESINAGVIFRL
jgi:hypothetical protein